MLSEIFGGLSDNPDNIGGETFKFWRGFLVSHSKEPRSTGYGYPPQGNYGMGGGLPLELTEPFAVYGTLLSGIITSFLYSDNQLDVIGDFWRDAGEVKSVYGRPL